MNDAGQLEHRHVPVSQPSQLHLGCTSDVALIGYLKPNAGMTVLGILPIYRCTSLGAGLSLTADRESWVDGPTLGRPQQRSQERVVVAEPGSGEGPEHPRLVSLQYKESTWGECEMWIHYLLK